MGRLAIILVLGLSMTVGYIGYTLNQSKTQFVTNVSGFDRFSNARNIAHTGVSMMLRRIDRGDTVIMNPLPRGQTSLLVTNVVSGVCSVSIKLPNVAKPDTIALTSKSKYMDSTYTVKAVLVRTPVPFPTPYAAVSVRASPAKFTNDGQPIIDGRNYTVDGTSLKGSGDQAGIRCMTKADSITLSATWGFPQLNGNPKPPQVDPTIPDPSDYASVYINARDYYYPTGTYSNVTWGSSAAPVIVDCVTPDTLETVKFQGNVEGWGILIVRGKLTITGTFKFHGLVLVYADNNVVDAINTDQNAQIIGALILAGGPNTLLDSRGNSTVKFSSDALNQAKYIGKLLYYQVVSWYE